jgi:photosystem II stability/assembly factor-like uncharacterized protein
MLHVWREGRGAESMRGWGIITTLVVALALTAGCAQASGANRAPTPTITATATPLPAAPLSWQTGTQQIGFPVSMKGLLGFSGNVAVAPGDGSTAYACMVTRGANATEASASVWLTHDRAAHWMEKSSVASAQISSAPNSRSLCAMAIDQTAASTAALTVVWQSTPDDFTLTDTSTLVTFDGGATWQQLTSPVPAIINQLATWQGSTYAIREVGAGPVPEQTDMMLSRDHLRTWQPIDQPITAGQQPGQLFFRSFWVHPSSGEILVETDGNTAGGTEQLWDTRDGGQHWKHLPVPAIQSVFVEAPAAGQPWHICGVAGSAGPGSLMCSVDGGQSWTSRPNPGSVVAIADDGAVLETAPGDLLVSGSSQQSTLYRLAAGASAWQSLGPAPGSEVGYAPDPTPGLLWSLLLSGTPTNYGQQTSFLTAAYP